MRVKNWAKTSVLLLTPAANSKNYCDAQAYPRLLSNLPFLEWLACCKTAIEPVLKLFAKVLELQRKIGLKVQLRADLGIKLSGYNCAILSIRS